MFSSAVFTSALKTFNNDMIANATAIVVIHVDAITSYVGAYVSVSYTVVTLSTTVDVVFEEYCIYPSFAIPKLPQISAGVIKNERIEHTLLPLSFVSDKAKKITDITKKNSHMYKSVYPV